MRLVLYHLTSCPFCWRVRFAAWRLGLTLPMRNLLSEPAARGELLTGGGKLQVPCLRIEEEGRVHWLYESADIIAFLKRHRQAD